MVNTMRIYTDIPTESGIYWVVYPEGQQYLISLERYPEYLEWDCFTVFGSQERIELSFFVKGSAYFVGPVTLPKEFEV